MRREHLTMGTGRVKESKESVTWGEGKNTKQNRKSPFPVPRTFGWKASGREVHRCLQTGKKGRDGLRGSRAGQWVRRRGQRMRAWGG